MPYLIQPPVHSVDACNPLFTYTLANPTPSELSKLKDFQNWSWEVSVHFHDDAEYLAAIEGTDKATKKRRRRTQMVYGDMMGDGLRLTFEEVWERESTKKLTQGLYEMEANEKDVSDQASIMSQMTQQGLWVRWADEEAELETEEPNDIQAVNEQSPLPTLSPLKDGKNVGDHVHQGSAGSPITKRQVNSTSRFSEEDEVNCHAIASSHSFQRADSQPAGRKSPQSSAPFTPTGSSEESDLLLNPYMLAMATCGHWCPPAFLQAWSHQHSTLQAFQPSHSTTLSDSSSGTLQPITSTDSDLSLYLHLNTSTLCLPEPRSISPALSTASSLIFPGREITQEEYFRRTNRPRENLQPRQLTPPPGLEAENDPYEWQAWDRRHAQQDSKTDSMLGRDSMRRSSAGNASRGRNRNSWYDEFQKKMKEEQIRAQKEQKEADKEKKKEMRRLEKQQRKRKEDEAREALKKQGMFSGGYLPRYT